MEGRKGRPDGRAQSHCSGCLPSAVPESRGFLPVRGEAGRAGAGREPGGGRRDGHRGRTAGKARYRVRPAQSPLHCGWFLCTGQETTAVPRDLVAVSTERRKWVGQAGSLLLGTQETRGKDPWSPPCPVSGEDNSHLQAAVTPSQGQGDGCQRRFPICCKCPIFGADICQPASLNDRHPQMQGSGKASSPTEAPRTGT